MTDTAPEVRGGFPKLKPVDAPAELGRFVAAMRRLQDLTVSTNPESAKWTTAAEQVENVCALLEGHQVPEGGRRPAASSNFPGWAIPSCHRGLSSSPDRTASPWKGTSPAPMWAVTTPCTAA